MNGHGVQEIGQNVAVHHARYGAGAEPDFEVCQTDFGLATGFGAYDVEFLHGRPNELVLVLDGVMTAHVGARRWVLTPQRAIWLPAGVPSEVVANRRSRAYCLLLPAPVRSMWTEPTPVELPPLLTELVQHLGGPGLDDAAAHRAHAVLYDLLRPAHDDGLRLVLPRDPRALAVADALLADPADTRSLEDWAATVFASTKTLQRLFLGQTGSSFPQWRAQARLYASLPRLADRMPVGTVAHEVGYRSVTGFVTAFRHHFGHPPGAHYGGR